MDELWKGLRPSAREQLSRRDYHLSSLAERLATTGVEAGEILAISRASLLWIPGVELFARQIFPQRHRGFFGELARAEDGPLAELGLWPKQWATARMFAGTAKGFHIHPPHIPAGEKPEPWLARLFGPDSSPDLRPYDREQWDVMFFLQGTAEIFLIDERAGFERRQMRLLISGDDQRGNNNAAIVIPPGVAHAIRGEGSSDLIMVYGTSTKFDPAFEGRIASEIETASLPAGWAQCFNSPGGR